MAALPGGEWSEHPGGEITPLGTVRHIFTHFTLDLHLIAAAEPVGEGWWQPITQLGDAGFPSLYRKAAETAALCSNRLAA